MQLDVALVFLLVDVLVTQSLDKIHQGLMGCQLVVLMFEENDKDQLLFFVVY
jgi:hypothetical protein